MRFSLDDRAPAVEFEDMVQLTFDALGDVPDFRGRKGRELDLGGILALIVAGLASGKNSFRQVASFGKRRKKDLIPMLGLKRPPSHATVWRIATRVDPNAIRRVLNRVGGEELRGRFDIAVSVDAKFMRGSRGEAGERAEIVMATDHSSGIVLDAAKVPHRSSELPVGRKMMKELARRPQVAVTTGDALYAENGAAEDIVRSGCDYVFKLKKTSLTS